MGACIASTEVQEGSVWRISRVDGGGYRIINEDSGRIIYAAKDGNWCKKCGAVSPEDEVGTDCCVWDIEVTDDGFIFINKDLQRVLYVQDYNNWEEAVGAGWPRNCVHGEGVWLVSLAYGDD